jgi:phage terminase small subunit
MDEKKLNPQQELFCLEYLKDFNATAAAKRAKYSEKTSRAIGSKLLTNVDIQLRLHALTKEVFDEAKEDIKAIVQELKMIAFSDIKDVISWGMVDETVESMSGESYTVKRNRILVKDSEEIGDKSRTIAEVAETHSIAGVSRKLKLHSKMEALRMLGQYHKMFTEKIDLSNSDGTLKPQVTVYLPKNGRES